MSIYFPKVYDQNLESALLELGLDARGVAASAGWEIDPALLRSWLRKLRGICTHPQVDLNWSFNCTSPAQSEIIADWTATKTRRQVNKAWCAQIYWGSFRCHEGSKLA